jgi:heavy metal efflux system protein
MFHPMAFTVVLALTGGDVLSLTFVPAAVAHRPRRPGAGRRTGSCRGARAYEPVLRALLRARSVVCRAHAGRSGAV